MRKKLLCIILVMALTFPLGGCGEPNPETVDNRGTAEAGSTDPAGEDFFLSLENLPWQDNSLDAYSAVLNVPLRDTEPEGALIGVGPMYFLGSTGASVFQRHFFSTAADNWDEIKTFTDQGEETFFHLAFREGQLSQVRAAGGIAGSDHYILMDIEWNDDGSLSYRFFEADEAMQVLNVFYADCLDKNDYEVPNQLFVDAGGNLHMVTYRDSDDTRHYYIVAADGTLLKEVSPKEGFPAGQTPKLILLYDGRVGTWLGDKLQCVDVLTGETELLANVKANWRSCTLLDEETLLYADGVGLYRSGLSGQNPELLYAWGNHGISASQIEAMQVTGSGEIGLIYMDYSGANYLKLIPTTEEVEILEITFAVSSSASPKYQAAVTAFNKMHPTYRIRLQDYGYSDTTLLTEMIAGKGPVLLDTFLVNFEDNAEWWEPLDEFFRQADLEEELIPQAVNAGRIDGTLYGVVTDFSINTVVTFLEEPDEWDYDTFLGCFDEDDPSIKCPYDPGVGGGDGSLFIWRFFYHSLQEKYLFDAENGTTRFDSEEFHKILRLARYFMDKEHRGNSEDLRQGTSPCAVVSINTPEYVAYLRIWGGDTLKFIGFPSGEGSKHYIDCGSPITVRVNATAEEKRLAYSFLRFLLSYDVQMEAVSATSNNFRMSVRKDVLEEQVNRVEETSYPALIGFPQFRLGDQVDNELDGATLYGLLEKAEPKQSMPRELSNIFNEELDDYLSGDITEDMLIEYLENRVKLYLSEQK